MVKNEWGLFFWVSKRIKYCSVWVYQYGVRALGGGTWYPKWKWYKKKRNENGIERSEMQIEEKAPWGS